MKHKLFQSFRAGTFPDMKDQQLTFSEPGLQKMAAAFDTKRRPAPLVLGHPEDGQPEMGQVQKPLVKGSKLYAQALVGAALEDLVKARRYAYVSASFIRPFADGNERPSRSSFQTASTSPSRTNSSARAKPVRSSFAPEA